MRPCTECSNEVHGRSDRKQCCVECKQAAKRRYDRERYPSIRGALAARRLACRKRPPSGCGRRRLCRFNS